MVKKYIRGHETRSEEVKKVLKELGAGKYEFFDIDYKDTSILFFVGEFSEGEKRVCGVDEITYVGRILLECFEEIKLPPVFESKEYVVRYRTEKITGGCEGCCLLHETNEDNKPNYCFKPDLIGEDISCVGIIFKKVTE